MQDIDMTARPLLKNRVLTRVIRIKRKGTNSRSYATGERNAAGSYTNMI